MSARNRDRRVYWASHPFLFAGLAVIRHRAVCRIRSRVIVNQPEAMRHVLTELPLDRVSDRTTGGVIRKNDVVGALFDESGDDHRASRRAVAETLDASGVAALRHVWMPVLDDAVARLRAGELIDLCGVADEMAGRTTAALLGLDLSTGQSIDLARAARATAASAAASEVPSLRRRRYRDHIGEAFGDRIDARGTMLAMAAVTTTHATLPRAVAWVADDDLWGAAGDDAQRPVLVAELLRVLAPTPLLPRAVAERAEVAGCPVTPADQILLMTRHAVGAHRRDPSVTCPAPMALSQLVFGVGRHACPGAALARAQLADVLAALAPLRPRVRTARADRHSALPAWRSLVVST
ncbi:hypothetical protein [Williamsia sp.]|uniref:hypothetical protein n=1 Tax=Williamsia sp. TaxID=1872085 RepID=UPI001A33BF79|nr:hypothetical protein [Williamsia sp.]MBJ7288818.1 cytochrome P450 [Williamsia sp.]